MHVVFDTSSSSLPTARDLGIIFYANMCLSDNISGNLTFVILGKFGAVSITINTAFRPTNYDG
jgi:hypothetical protein